MPAALSRALLELQELPQPHARPLSICLLQAVAVEPTKSSVGAGEEEQAVQLCANLIFIWCTRVQIPKEVAPCGYWLLKAAVAGHGEGGGKKMMLNCNRRKRNGKRFGSAGNGCTAVVR